MSSEGDESAVAREARKMLSDQVLITIQPNSRHAHHGDGSPQQDCSLAHLKEMNPDRNSVDASKGHTSR
jgi:hypothetical protein